MNILLYGEFSGVHKGLQAGLTKLGYDCVLASRGDSWKEISGDISLGGKRGGIHGKLSRIVIPLAKLPRLINYDIIQFISPFEYYPHKGLRKFTEFLIKNSGRSYVLAAGCDAVFYERIQDTGLKYHPCPACLKYDQKATACKLGGNLQKDWQSRMMDLVDGIIPISESYDLLYQGHPKKKPFIDMPIDSEKLEYLDNNVKNKVVFFHGLNRYGFKGTFLVERVFEKIQRKYPNDVEMIITDRMPFREYLKFLSRVNIVVDQIFGYGLGMNSLISMALGRVVLTRYDEKLMEGKQPPCFNLIPTEKDIERKITQVLDMKEKITELGFESRCYVERHHNCESVARKFLEVWYDKVASKAHKY